MGSPPRLAAFVSGAAVVAFVTANGFSGDVAVALPAGSSTGPRATLSASCVRTVVAAGDMEGIGAVRATGRLAVSLHPGLIAALGDEQYPAGSFADFRRYYATSGWGRLKARTRPVPGNHEYLTRGAAGYFAYFNNPPRYYAYDLGCGWRAYALNSEIGLAKEARWLRRDLAAHPRARVLAYWHRPFISSGVGRGTPSMVALWRAFLGRPTIVLNGHRHNYERLGSRHRIREFVVGTGGSTDGRFRRTPAAGSARRVARTPGVLRLRLSRGSYTWSFRNTSNRTLDSGSG
jgi:hypothetical protein